MSLPTIPEGFGQQYKAQDYIIYSSLCGSRGFGLADDDSDYDRRGVFLLPEPAYRSLSNPKQTVEYNEPYPEANTEWVVWELKHFLSLCLQANPNVLETLFAPTWYTNGLLGLELRDKRKRFLSQRVFNTYGRYVDRQFLLASKKYAKTGEINYKAAMHSLRLLYSGTVLLKTGELPEILPNTIRARLLAVKHEECSWPEIVTWETQLADEFYTAKKSTTLPKEPNWQWAEYFLQHAHAANIQYE
jgi:hypothetical protein